MKGCQNIQRLSDYQKEVKNRASVMNIVSNNLNSMGSPMPQDEQCLFQMRMKNSLDRQLILEL